MSPKKPRVVKKSAQKAPAETQKPELTTLEIRKLAPDSEFSIDFLDRMLFHMGGASLEKYGPCAERYPRRAQAIDSVMPRFIDYFLTRNRKFLVDAANFCMIEFMHPSQKGAFFAATSSDDSPGLIGGGDKVMAHATNIKTGSLAKPSGVKITLETTTPESELNQVFIQGMINRMGVSYGKYGPVANNYPIEFHSVKNVMKRLSMYVESGNTEFLIDAANFCMVEFMYPSLVTTTYTPFEDPAEAGRAVMRSLFSKS